MGQGAQATLRLPRLWQEPDWSTEPPEKTSGKYIYHYTHIQSGRITGIVEESQGQMPHPIIVQMSSV